MAVYCKSEISIIIKKYFNNRSRIESLYGWIHNGHVIDIVYLLVCPFVHIICNRY